MVLRSRHASFLASMPKAPAKTCPHDSEHHISISGTRQCEMLSKGEDIPVEFSRPEVVRILYEFYASLD